MPVVSPSPAGTLSCPECGTVLSPHALDPREETVCPGCRTRMYGQLFPEWWKSSVAPAATTSDRALDGDAVCFFHPANRAALACDSCGRFICVVCDLPLGSRHLCPSCLTSGLDKGKLEEVVPRRFLWSKLAFWFGLVPWIVGIVFWPFFIATGPTAIIIAIVGWKRPGSLVGGRKRWAAVTGIILGLLQLVFWIGFIVLIANAKTK